jgi:hypothetical protein
MMTTTIPGGGFRPRKPPIIPGFILEEEQAKRLGGSLATRRLKRRAGIGPRYFQNGDQIFYPEDPDAEYLIGRLADPKGPEPVHRGRPGKVRTGAVP